MSSFCGSKIRKKLFLLAEVEWLKMFHVEEKQSILSFELAAI